MADAETGTPEADRPAGLEARGLVKQYNGRVVVDGVSVAIGPGEVMVSW